MKKVIEGMVLLSLASSLCFAETWTGKLIDATCADQNKSSAQNAADPNACAPKNTTSSFAIQTSDGRVFKLDATGNAKAAEIFKTSSNKSNMDVTISGTMSGETVKVDSLSAH